MASNSAEPDGVVAAQAIVVLPRAGRPPLRVRARQVCSHRMSSCLGAGLHITLWMRVNGSPAVSFTRPVGAHLVEDSAQADTVGALAEWLEGECVRLRDQRKLPRDQSDFDALMGLQGARALEREFMTLVGDALADWEAVCSC
jgi:hypothetical protein